MSVEYWAIVLFAMVFLLIMAGFPVAFTLGGISLIFGWIFLDDQFFHFMPSRIMGIMNNYVLIAVPMFIFMGIVLEQSGIAQRLLLAISRLLGNRPGGVAIATVLVGALLAASTGIVGATVVTMGLISLPVMLRMGYSPEIATGTIAASGTLGQIIPPSIVLVLLGSIMNIPVGKLFSAAIVPGIILVIGYLIYLFIYFKMRSVNHKFIDNIIQDEGNTHWLHALMWPIALIIVVLGSIFAGIASPTEASAIGAFGAMLMAIVNKKFTKSMLMICMKETMYLSTMIFFILIGASTFALVFRGMGGDHLLVDFVSQSGLTQFQFILVVMVVLFLAGFFIDFIEIIFILVPILTPIFILYKIDLIWIAILISINLQTSFLTPPFGFALFYLKGVAPATVTTAHMYRGIIPFILIQLGVLAIFYLFPGLMGR